ncbi:unnamed protein product [Calypogeia fissa]
MSNTTFRYIPAQLDSIRKTFPSRLMNLMSMFGSKKGSKEQQTGQQIDASAMNRAQSPEEAMSVNSVVTMGEGSSSSKRYCTGLGDLPEAAIASILSLTSPRDVARLSCVNRSFRAASDSDQVWQKMLPPFYTEILDQALNPPSRTSPKKEVYNFFCNRALFQNGTRDFWLDRASGAGCQSIGARELDVIWSNEDQYWGWCPKEGARYSEVAYLKHVWWLKVKGRWQCHLSPGNYILSWRLSLPGRDHKMGPVTFSFEASGNAPLSTKCYLTGQGPSTLRGGWSEGHQQPLGYRWEGDSWMELDIGEFTVVEEDSPFEIEFHLKDIDCSRVKGDLYVDGVMIRPSSTTTMQNRIALTEFELPQVPPIRYPRRGRRLRQFGVDH